MPINLELGMFIPERFKRPYEGQSYGDYVALLELLNAKDIYALPVIKPAVRTRQEREEYVLKYKLYIEFRSASSAKRKINYDHECSEIKTSDPAALDTRSSMVPDWDIRVHVWERIEDARAHTFLSGLYMLRDIGKKIPGMKTHLRDRTRIFTDEDIKELIDHAGLRKLSPWPNTPSFDI